MSLTERVSFSRNLRRFLGPSWFNRTMSASRVGSTSKSLSTDPIQQIDSAFATLGDHYQSPDRLAGFQSVTRQFLANDVLDTLIQLQSEIMSFDQLMDEREKRNARAVEAYRRAFDNYAEINRPIFTPES